VKKAAKGETAPVAPRKVEVTKTTPSRTSIEATSPVWKTRLGS
jgi:hypothetical protein